MIHNIQSIYYNKFSLPKNDTFMSHFAFCIHFILFKISINKIIMNFGGKNLAWMFKMRKRA